MHMNIWLQMLYLSIYTNNIEYLIELVIFEFLFVKAMFSIKEILQGYSMQMILVVFGVLD